MNPNTLTEALSEAELEELDRFLCSDAVPEEAMDLAMLDGFVTAVVSGPNLMMPSTMMRWIWDAEEGTATPDFADKTEAARMLGFVMRHWNEINGVLNEAPEAYEPLTYQRESDGKTIKIIDEWCMGYFRAIMLDRAAWEPLLTERPEWFATITLYATVAGWDDLKRREFSEQTHEAHAASLAHCVRKIHRYWLEWRRERIARGEAPDIMPKGIPHRSAPKVGRNDPCPCGSGKKYKRCHGAGEREELGNAPRRETPSSAPDEAYPLHSPLCQTVTRDGTSVAIQIYEDGEGGWLLEVEDEFGNSTVWDDSFSDDSAALAEVLDTIETNGIASLVGSPPEGTTQH